ncbi:peroxiredoxin [Candidatus Uhrbacteria bacterium]|nr:peroxiredoxin [Candidatus Uhrbacteria bacterium]
MSPSSVLRLQPGSKAPDFTLLDDQGNDVSLTSAIGPKGLVLIFYPGDLSPGCTVQLCSIRDDWSKFQQAGITVYGINHADADSHRLFRTTHSLPFPLLVDTDREISKAYGALHSFLGFHLIKRTVVGIDNQGKILFYMHGMPKDSDILKTFSLT